MKLDFRVTDGLGLEEMPGLLPDSAWYVAEKQKEGLIYRMEAGVLAGYKWLTCDGYNPSPNILVLTLELYETGNPLPSVCRFTLLPKVQGRLRFDLEAVKQNRWRYSREGGCLKPTMSGGRVDLAQVDRVEIKTLYKEAGRVRWCLTSLRASVEEPELLRHPVLPEGPVLDALGQASYRNWSGKTTGESELKQRLLEQSAASGILGGPESYSSWGGWKDRKVPEKTTGYFRVHHDGRRWWLLDPEGHCFWSTGPCCVSPKIESTVSLLREALAWLPEKEGDYASCFFEKESDFDLALNGEGESFDYLRANLIRVFGPGDWKAKWDELVFPLMRRIGFNTVANWSDTAAASQARMAYVLPMVPAPAGLQVPRIFRDFPDVYSAAFEKEAEVFAAQLGATAKDPALIGYFLMNEPQWGFTDLLLAEGMLWNSPACESRKAFALWLKDKYGDVALWGMDVSICDVESGSWTKVFSAEARRDLREFSTLMVRKLYESISTACRKVDPDHLNLGARFSSVPKDWVLEAMGTFDVFSINCYQPEVDPRLEEICRKLNVPALIGEWHYGALDAGLPAPGIGHVANQHDRGRAYRYYVETSAAHPWCVGAHWFTLYDQSAIGRFDGENYNIGFLDTCHRIYEPLAGQALQTHQRLYEVADGTVPPFAEAPVIVERLNM